MKHKSLISVLLFCFCMSVSAYDWQTDLQHRLRCDFDQSRESVVNYIRQYIPHVTDEQIARWEETGALEQMILDCFLLVHLNLFRLLFHLQLALQLVLQLLLYSDFLRKD